MTSIKHLLAFLSSLWGALAVAAIAFPGATALLNVPIAVSNSTIAGLYPVIGTIVSAFATLFLIAYKQNLTKLQFAQKLAVWGMILGLVCFFSFGAVRLFVLDTSAFETISGPSQGSTTRITRDRGIIEIEIWENDMVIRHERRGDPFDLLGLFLFAGIFASLTFGFTALGIHAYQQKEP